MTKKKKKTCLKFSFSPLLFIFLLALAIFIAYHLAFLNRIYPHVQVAETFLSGQTLDQAKKTINAKIDYLPKSLLFVSPNKAWEIDLEKIGFDYQAEKTVEKAFRIGRSSNLLSAWSEKKQAWLKGIHLGLDFEFNQEAYKKEIEPISASLYVPAVNPQIEVLEKRLSGDQTETNLKRVIVQPGQNGQELDEVSLLAIFSQNLAEGNFQPINLPIIKTMPALSSEEAENLRQRAEKFLDKTLEISFEEMKIVLDDKQLIGFIAPYGGFDQEKIQAFLESNASSIERPAQNASFRFENDKVTVFKPATEGISLKKNQNIEALAKKLALLENSSQEKETLVLEVEKLEPKVKTEEVNDLGIRELVGKGESYFRGSIPSRIHNIILASSRINGLLVEPGETFSFNSALGDVSQTTGYKEAYIIQAGRTVLGDGGGVCQVSTTLFRAVLNAGLPIIERRAHAYRVGYYEQGFPPGLDATVFSPTADFKFQNNTPAHLLIQTSVDKSKNYLVFELYGTNDGRTITLGKTRIWDQNPPPADLYQDDPTLPIGTIKQVDWSAWGAKTAFDWKVQRQGEILEERTFYSAYKPWQAVYLRGTANQ